MIYYVKIISKLVKPFETLQISVLILLTWNIFKRTTLSVFFWIFKFLMLWVFRASHCFSKFYMRIYILIET